MRCHFFLSIRLASKSSARLTLQRCGLYDVNHNRSDKCGELSQMSIWFQSVLIHSYWVLMKSIVAWHERMSLQNPCVWSWMQATIGMPNQNSNVNDPNQNKQITKRSSSFEVNKCFVTTTKEQKTKKKNSKYSGINYYNCHGFFTHSSNSASLKMKLKWKIIFGWSLSFSLNNYYECSVVWSFVVGWTWNT